MQIPNYLLPPYEAGNDRREVLRCGGVTPPPLAIEAAPIESNVDDRLLDVVVSGNQNRAIITKSSHLANYLQSALFNQGPVEETDENNIDSARECGSLNQNGSTNNGESSQWALTIQPSS